MSFYFIFYGKLTVAVYVNFIDGVSWQGSMDRAWAGYIFKYNLI